VIDFGIPNMVELYGKQVRDETKTNLSVQNGRIVLQSLKLTITMDKLSDYKERQKELKQHGGYIFQYASRIEKSSGNLSQQELSNIVPCLNTFLSFINGKRTAAYLSIAKHDTTSIFSDLSPTLLIPTIMFALGRHRVHCLIHRKYGRLLALYGWKRVIGIF
jgi:hypothetical protein